MAHVIEVDIKTLKESYGSAYDKAYEKWVSDWWGWDMEVDYHKEGLKETYKWLDVDDLLYSVSYSQGDFAAFTGRVDLLKFLDEHDTANEYFVLREAIRIGSCDPYLSICDGGRRYVSFDSIEWRDEHPDYAHEEWTLIANNSPLDGMLYRDFYDIATELLGDLQTWVEEVCKQAFQKLYYDIRDDIEYQTSEESFIDCAEANEYKFEVEVDDEDIGDVSDNESRRLAA